MALASEASTSGCGNTLFTVTLVYASGQDRDHDLYENLGGVASRMCFVRSARSGDVQAV